MYPQKEVRPYTVYDIKVTKIGLENIKIEGVKIFEGETTTQNIYMHSESENVPEEIIKIPEQELLEEESPKVIENHIKFEIKEEEPKEEKTMIKLPLKLTDNSEDVKKLHLMLQKLHYPIKDITNHFNENTQRLVKAFQNDSGLKVTGIIDDNTWNALEKATRDKND